MYEDMYKEYKNSSFPYDYPISFIKENKEYLETYPPINAWWYYGETVNIKLKLCDKDFTDEKTLPEYFDDKTIRVCFYNFRKECILSKDFTSNDIIDEEEQLLLNYFIDIDTSKNVFKRDVYCCGIQILYTENEIENSITILDNNDYTIRVI